jgi:cell division protein FtsZ
MPPVQHAFDPALNAPPARPLGHPLATQANPVGDVHERIRRMLTEGTMDTVGAPRMPAPAQTVAPAPVAAHASPRGAQRNPFREAAEELQRTSIAALDLLKSLTPKAEEPSIRVEEQPARPARTAHGDLFDDEEDGELEIPSFLRKKKVS